MHALHRNKWRKTCVPFDLGGNKDLDFFKHLWHLALFSFILYLKNYLFFHRETNRSGNATLWRGEKILSVRNQYGFYHSMAFIKYNTIQPVGWKECFILVKSISGYLSDTLVHFPTGSGWTPKRQWSQIKKQRRPPEGSLFVEWNDSKQRGLRLFS